MSIEITPRGTRGARVPGFLRPLMRFGMGRMQASFRRSGGKTTMRGQPLLLLTTIGAKSGQRRGALLARFPDGDSDRSWLVAGTAMGAASHPAWLVNMARHPDQVWIETGGRQLRVQVEQLRGAERDGAWARIVELNPSFGPYATRTDRELPVLRLTALQDPPKP